MRSYYKRPRRNTVVSLFDRLLAIASYLTGGFIGFIWLIIAFIAKKNLKSFIKFHALQSVLLGFCLYVASLVLSIFINILIMIPVVGKFILTIVFFIKDLQIVQIPNIYHPIWTSFSLGFIQIPTIGMVKSTFSYSFLECIILVVLFYLIFGAIRGKKSYIPVISDAIKRMM